MPDQEMVSLARRRSPDAQCRPSLVEATTLEPLTPALFDQSEQHARPARPAYCFSDLFVDVDVRILSQHSVAIETICRGFGHIACSFLKGPSLQASPIVIFVFADEAHACYRETG